MSEGTLTEEVLDDKTCIIILTGKKAEAVSAFTFVSEEDFDFLSNFRWHMAATGYPASWDGRRVITMHHAVATRAGMFDTGLTEIDHKNTIRLDNRRSNLRPCTRAENCSNIGLSKRNSSGIKGVCFDRSEGKWKAQLKVNGRLVLNKRFKTIEEAREAVVKARTEHCGEFANHG